MKRDEVYLRHILDAIEKIETYSGVGKDAFMTASHWQDATIMSGSHDRMESGERAPARVAAVGGKAVVLNRAGCSEPPENKGETK